MLSWLAVCCSGLMHINAAYRGPRWQYYLFKPLTILCLIAIALVAGEPGTYRDFIIVGLVFSLAGDVLLMLPKERFVSGLSSFFLAHLCYSGAFWQANDGNVVLWLPFMLAAFGVILFLLLLPNLGRFVLPVAIYILMISQMTWAAGQVWLAHPGQLSGFAFCGALLFMFSDAVLAVDKFKGPFKSATMLIMGSYFLSQALITASALG
ncbi:lysoplasmalogenase [Veronia pacifica]|uniref:Lysoplasmalogenase n=1 Tax=Veronia pacifica TaxID=1080227 RepID=A0A1C3EJ43_9GAMM|nr:lysoplasmalogenase [Veronia pacifica]ODA33250.1 hypothetical protein A8L45_10620 [Veronia pacifica]